MTTRTVRITAAHLEVLLDLAGKAGKQGAKVEGNNQSAASACYEVAAWLKQQATTMRDNGGEIEIDDDALTELQEVRTLAGDLRSTKENMQQQIIERNRQTTTEAQASRVQQFNHLRALR